MIIEIESKNGALTQTIQASGSAVPRVGEEIDLAQDGGYLQGATRLMVLEVTWRLADNQLTPLVRCRPSRFMPDQVDQARRELLEELGWLPAQHRPEWRGPVIVPARLQRRHQFHFSARARGPRGRAKGPIQISQRHHQLGLPAHGGRWRPVLFITHRFNSSRHHAG